MKIETIDKNFAFKTDIDKKDLCWKSARHSAFTLHGLMLDEKGYLRMPTEVANTVNDGVRFLHRNTSGGRLTFETNSAYIAVFVKGRIDLMPHFALTGSGGFDLYFEDEDGALTYYKTFVPPMEGKRGYTSIVEFDAQKMRKILLHFPLYSAVDELYIGVSETATLRAYTPYPDEPPIVFYGSSITQGGCASRPGNNYPAIVSQKMKRDFLCLGFSGSAHGEQTMAQYIAALPMSVFVLDYDYNDNFALDDLRRRHYPFYRTIREKNADLPIVFMSAPYSECYRQNLEKSYEIVRESYEKAKANGDNVYFIDGQTMFGEVFKGCATVDGCHPNDFGFVKMAQAVIDVLESMQK